MADVTIDVASGGTAAPSDTITWTNSTAQRVHVTGLAGICAQGDFHVPPQANGQKGQHGVGVLPNAPVGSHVYTITPDLTNTTATLRISTSSK